VYKQLLSVRVLAYKVSFSTNKVGPGQLLIASVSGYRSALIHATAHTRGRWAAFKVSSNDNKNLFKMLIKYMFETER
jgi:hypothetical protein